MHISLTSELEKFVRGKVESGLYNNSSEVVREALRLLQRREEIESAKFERLKQDIQQGLEAVKRGDVHSLDIEHFITNMKQAREKADG